MHFHIFTSLIGLIFIILIFFITYKIYKKFKTVIKSATTVFSDELSSFSKDIHSDLISTQIDHLQSLFLQPFDNARAIEQQADYFTRDKVKDKVLLYLISMNEIRNDYFKVSQKLNENMSKAIENNNFDLVEKIKSCQNNIDFHYNSMINGNLVLKNDVLSKYVKNGCEISRCNYNIEFDPQITQTISKSNNILKNFNDKFSK